MAEIVLGLATSHSPQLSLPPELWRYRGDNDFNRGDLWGPDGQIHSYDELREMAPPSIEKELTDDAMQARYDACQQGIARLGALLEEATPDVVVVVGDDQHELLKEDNMPAISVYWGETIHNVGRKVRDDTPPDARASAWAYGDERDFPVASALGRHVVESLVDQAFDVGHNRYQTEGRGAGHAWGFVWQRIMGNRVVPVVPILLNTYFPPNQPTPQRCHDLGLALGRAIADWDSGARVAVMASGGLTHFVITEEFDRMVLKALEDKDVDTLGALDRKMLNSGNSEIRNWIAAGAAAGDLEFSLIDYVPCYRSPAMTGCAMGFAQWS